MQGGISDTALVVPRLEHHDQVSSLQSIIAPANLSPVLACARQQKGADPVCQRRTGGQSREQCT
eukprot:3939187-Rhodomonas_salina.1